MLRLHDFLDHHARERPDVEFARFDNRSITYAEARALVNQAAHALVGQGLHAGDRMAILSKNSLEYPLLYFACSKAGVVPVPLNYRLAPGEWAYIINDARAQLVLVSPDFALKIDKLRGDLSGVRGYVLLDSRDADEYVNFYEWIRGQPTDAPERNVHSDDDVWQMYTSGTTGYPKGAVIRHRSIVANAVQFHWSVPRNPGERTLVVAPLYHAAGTITFIAAVAAGGTLYLLKDFDPAEVVRVLAEENIAHTTLVPAMLQACLVGAPDVASRDYSSLKKIMYGASPIAEETLRRAMEVFQCQFYQAYGLTETTAILTILSHEDHRRAVRDKPELLLSAGRPMVGTRIKIVGADDKEAPPNCIGEIWGQGPQIMRGYWNLDEATEQALSGGWLRTGDAGRMDEEGYLYVEDRVKDMIISGGENIYPREVENCLFRHEAVADCAVIGIPDDRWGEVVKAVVCLKPGREASREELIGFCRERIAHFKCPTHVVFVPELPRTASGKVLKRKLREKDWEGRSRRIS